MTSEPTSEPTSPPTGHAPAAVVNHVGQCVEDLDRSVRFYVELLGFEVDRELVVPDAAAGPLLGLEAPIGLKAVYLRNGDFQLELMHFDRASNPGFAERVFNEPGLTHLSISVEDFEGVTSRVEQLGGTILTQFPVALMVRDPDGQLLEILPMDYKHRIDAERAARLQP